MNKNPNPTHKDASLDAVPRDLRTIYEETGNIYQSLVVISRRADELSRMQKDEIMERLAEFAPVSGDSLDEVHENKEQIEISQAYERRPKPTIQATLEFQQKAFAYRLNDPEANKPMALHVDAP